MLIIFYSYNFRASLKNILEAVKSKKISQRSYGAKNNTIENQSLRLWSLPPCLHGSNPFSNVRNTILKPAYRTGRHKDLRHGGTEKKTPSF